MKKGIYLLLFTVFFMNCSADDNDKNSAIGSLNVKITSEKAISDFSDFYVTITELNTRTEFKSKASGSGISQFKAPFGMYNITAERLIDETSSIYGEIRNYPFSVSNNSVVVKVESIEKTKRPFGVNLSCAEWGHTFPGVYGQDFVYPSLKDFEYFSSKGFSLLRFPLKWERIQPQLNAELDNTELERLKTAIEHARQNGILLILDIHNYGRRNINGKDVIIGESGLEIQHLADLWKRLASVFKDYKNIYGYGLMNEPHDMLSHTPWVAIAQACISEIRKVDTRTPILVAGNRWSSASFWKEESDELKNLYDPSDKLIFEAHTYWDAGGGSYADSYDKLGASPYTGIEKVRPFVEWLRENDLKGFVGEYGVPDNDVRWLTCLDNFLTYLQDNGINGTYWAAGPLWGRDRLSVQPTQDYTLDRPQMKVLERHLYAK